jgi:hypothetical protein
VWSRKYMFSTHFAIIAHWLFEFESYVPAAVITAGAALLLGSAVSAVCSPCKEKDSIFHKQVV